MKHIVKTAIFLFIAFLVLPSCDESQGGEPVIKYIRPTDVDASDSLLVAASMGQTIAIIGENLQDVVSIHFNDQAAKLNPVYITSTSIIVNVPGSIPSEVTNTMTLITSTGYTVVYDFRVVITPPSLESISCEWAGEGSEAILYGNYFFQRSDGTISVLFPGNVEAEVVEFTQESITIIIPDGALQGYITVENDYGKGKSPFIFRDPTGIFIDAENPSAWNWWGLSDFASEGGIDGQYLSFEGTTGSWSWPANAIQLFYINPTEGPLVAEGDVADYALKFEVYCHEWHDTPMLVWFSNEYNTHDVDGADAQYHWKPYNKNGVFSNYTTDGWITVTFPLSEFKYSKDETESSRAIPDLSKLQNLNIIFFGPANEATTEFGLKMWMDNLRIVKINN